MISKNIFFKLNNDHFKIFFLLILLFIIFYRSPYILINGRFVAEEGSFWFRNAHLHGPFYALTQIFWGSSYLNLWSNIASFFSILVPIEYAPYVTVYFSLLIKLYLFIFIVFSESEFIKSNFDKAIISFIVLLSPPMVPEVWLNTLTSQVYFFIFCILILLQNSFKKNFFFYTSPIILFLGGMSSILCCALTPIFFLNFIKKKNKFNFINFFLILFSALVQFFIFIFSHVENLAFGGSQERFILSINKFINFLYNVYIKAFLGRPFTQFLYYNIFENLNFVIIFFSISLLIIFFFILILKNIPKDDILNKLFFAFFIISLLSFFASKDSSVQGRYAVAPGILSLFIFYRISQISSIFFRYFSYILVFISILAGAYEFKSRTKYPEFLLCNTSKWTCPDWKSEVFKWKNDKNYKMKIWNYPGKYMSLN